MQYWIKSSLAVGVLLSLSGCSIFINDAHHPRNYRANQPVQVPASLQAPSQDPDFKMDVAQYQAAEEPIGYRPPQQVLTVAQGTWIEEGDKVPRVFFDKNDGITDLSASIWQAVNGALQTLGTQVSTKDEAKREVVSGWVALIKPADGWFWEDLKAPSEQKFKFTLVQQEHQRTASLIAELVDYRSDDVPLTDLLKQQLEVRALNAVVAEYDYEYRLLQSNVRRTEGQLAFNVGFDKAGNAAIVASVPFERVFDRLSTVLEELSFSVDKINVDEATMNVRYDKPTDSVWDSIWGDDTPALPIESGEYQLSIAANQDGSSVITWRDGKGQLLDTATVQALQQGLLAAVQQKDVN
ncbi:outer membrane protein assembly factor BamC [Pseudoalteromonas fenneropenaei]|uniref:Outer membrane protein assembly factor BamC n=1 Tax=Pseudoalteromonas fenneropenaei TaxID=1737459 RepID=A0ABV7CI02_9GAMM